MDVLEDGAFLQTMRQALPSQQPPSTPSRKQLHLWGREKLHLDKRNGRGRAPGCGTAPLRLAHLMKVGLLLLVGAIVSAPTSTVLTWVSGMRAGVLAVPCASNTTTKIKVADGEAQPLIVEPNTTFDLTSVFNCEGGDFEVLWSGQLQLTGTIVIGNDTIVRIIGDGSSSTGRGNTSLSDHGDLDRFTNGLAIPLGLTSAAVGVNPGNITAHTDPSISFGPMFYVEGGTLTMQDMVVRSGFVGNITDDEDEIADVHRSGGGIFGLNSNVSVTRCEFDDNYAQAYGGGIFVNRSTVEVVDSVFRDSKAGYFLSTFEDDDVLGSGAAIRVRATKRVI